MIKQKLTRILGIAVLSATVVTGASPVFANASGEKISKDNTVAESTTNKESSDLEEAETENTTATESITEDENYIVSEEVNNVKSTESKSNNDAVEKNGWTQSKDGNWSYYKNDGSKAVGKYIYGPMQVYYFNEDGISAKGWTEIEGNMYYFKEIPSGGYEMAYNEHIDGYYVNNNGIRQDDDSNIQRGWIQSEDGNWRHYGNDGIMDVGLRNLGPNYTFLFDSKTGISLSGWQPIKGKMHYFKPNTEGFVMARNETIEGHYINSDGICEDFNEVGQTGWFKSPSTENWMYYDSEGNVKTGLCTIDNEKYYFDYYTGASLSGWQEIKGKTYYFKPSEHGFVMAKNETIEGKYINILGYVDADEQ